MTSLLPYQRELLRVLQDQTSARFGVVRSVVGSGVRRAIEIYIRDVAADSLALVLCPTRMLADQWVQRLKAHEDIEVVPLNSMTSLDLLERRQGPRKGVLVGTYAAARSGPSGRALAELEFGLIVHDQPHLPLRDEFASPGALTRRAIVIVDAVPQDWTSPWPLLWSITSEDLVRSGFRGPVVAHYEPTAEERAVRSRALDLLREQAHRRSTPLVLPSDSLPTLHSRLLTLASQPRQQDDLSERAWAVLDRMEDALNSDSRLVALDHIIERQTAAGARCVVLTATQIDAKYIADHIEATGKALRAVLSGATSLTDRRSALAGLNEGEVLVATRVVSESAEAWPANTTAILWPSPANRRVMEELFLTAAGTTGFKAVALEEAHTADTPRI